MGLHKVLTRQGYLIQKDQIDKKVTKEIIKDLTMKPLVFKAFQNLIPEKEFEIYQESQKYYFLPRYYGIEKFGPPVKDNLSEGAAINVKFIFDLLSHQRNGYQITLNALKQTGGGLLSVPCGWGKTATAIKLACELGRKVLVLVNKECLMDQWIESINKFTAGKARVGIIQQSTVDVKDKDFVVAMLHSISAKDYPKETFEDFGMTIIDECHHLGSEMFSKSLRKTASKYNLGLSATPRRKDGLSIVFHHHIGPLLHTEKRQGANRVLIKRFKLNSSSTKYETLYMNGGKIKNTGGMIGNLCEFETRTKLIIDSVRQLMKQRRKILILSSRREHLETIYDLLGSSGILTIDGKPITFGYYRGNQGLSKAEHKKMLIQSAKCDIVLGTYHIASEGLDIPDLNTGIQATPCSDVEQAVGRILRKYHSDLNPVWIEFVDKCGNFPTHASTRAKLYKEEDYEIQDYKLPIDDDPSCLDEYESEINEYLQNLDFKQSKFAYKEGSDDLDNYHIGQCLLDDQSDQKKKDKVFKITLKQKEAPVAVPITTPTIDPFIKIINPAISNDSKDQSDKPKKIIKIVKKIIVKKVIKNSSVTETVEPVTSIVKPITESVKPITETVTKGKTNYLTPTEPLKKPAKKITMIKDNGKMPKFEIKRCLLD